MGRHTLIGEIFGCVGVYKGGSYQPTGELPRQGAQSWNAGHAKCGKMTKNGSRHHGSVIWSVALSQTAQAPKQMD
jgi:hypothetical protein